MAILARRIISAIAAVAGLHIAIEVMANVLSVPPDTDPDELFGPVMASALLLAGSGLTAMLLLYSGVRGFGGAADARLWALRQRPTLFACTLGVVLLIATGISFRENWDVIFDDTSKALPLHIAFYTALSVIAAVACLPSLRKPPG